MVYALLVNLIGFRDLSTTDCMVYFIAFIQYQSSRYPNSLIALICFRGQFCVFETINSSKVSGDIW